MAERVYDMEEDDYVAQVFEIELVFRWDAHAEQGFGVFYQMLIYPVIDFLKFRGYHADGIYVNGLFVGIQIYMTVDSDFINNIGMGFLIERRDYYNIYY